MGGKSPKVDQSAMRKQAAALEAQEKRLAAQEAAQGEDERRRDAARIRTRKGRGAGGNTLLTGLETGLKDTLG